MPADVREVIGRAEIWRSLHTDSFETAFRRSHRAAATLEDEFERARLSVGLTVDPTLLEPWEDGASVQPPILKLIAPGVLTFGEMYERYMADPTHHWSARTRLAYETTQRLALSAIGESTPVQELSRALCRAFLDMLRHLPKNAAQRFPALNPRQAADWARSEGYRNVLSPANVNTYMNKLCGVLNWAVREEIIGRNPAKGLRLSDQIAKREKRRPFSTKQLRLIFDAPIYRGCENDREGYARVGSERPKGTRFWVPLIGLLTGLRLNEICQLETTDVRLIDGTLCIVVCRHSQTETDKRLKTKSSERIMPIHPELIAFGFQEFLATRRRAGDIHLFGDIQLGPHGFRSVAFSKWFTRFLRQVGAREERTCFHSFRHSFRDAMRDAQIERDVAMALGGWSGGGSGDVSDNYGRGFRARALFEAVENIRFPGLDLDHLRVPQLSGQAD